MEKPSKPIPENLWHPWMRTALSLGQEAQGWFTVVPATEQYEAWMTYFSDLGWMPSFMLEGRQVTMPVQWPQWLPVGWNPLKKTDRPRPHFHAPAETI